MQLSHQEIRRLKKMFLKDKKKKKKRKKKEKREIGFSLLIFPHKMQTAEEYTSRKIVLKTTMKMIN